MNYHRIWIIGGSSGIGLELVKVWLEKEYLIIASARNATGNEALLELKAQYPSELTLINIDVTSMTSIEHATQNALNIYNGIDIWFYNAAIYEVISLNNWHVKQHEEMMDINYLGIIRMISILIPYFQENKKGRWIWNSSLASYFGLPLGGGYSSSKSALINLAQSLQPELAQKGIELQVINHGFVQTRLTQKNSFTMPQLMTPHQIALRIIQAMEKPYHFEIVFPFTLTLILKFLRTLPYSVAFKITHYFLPKDK